MEICPMNAISKDSKTGAYLVNANVCSGCRLCTVACPSGAIEIDSVKKIAVKCDLCGGEPLCAKNCLAGAITFVEKDKAGLIRKREAIQKMSDRLILIAGEAEK
jgi:Fe-S-cluster-containing hydrogenase component 2